MATGHLGRKKNLLRKRKRKKISPCNMANERQGEKGRGQRVKSMCESAVLRMQTVYLNTIANQVGGFASALVGLKVRINQRAFKSVARQARRDERLPPLVTVGLVFPLAPRRLARSPLKALQRFGSSKPIETSCSYPNTAGFSGNLSLTGILVLSQDRL